MSDPGPATVQLRASFWPRYFRWTISFQLGWALFIGTGLAVRFTQDHWANMDWTYFALAWGLVSGVLAVTALLIAVRRRSLGCAELTPYGIRPYTTRYGWDFRYAWAGVEAVRVKAGPFGNRWLEVILIDGPPFKLAAHPKDPAAVLDAFERFAGPDHPLTQAYAALNADG